MADAEARIGINVDVSNALAGLRLLQKEMANFNLAMAQGTAAQRAQAQTIQKDLINNINASGKFAASIKTVSTSAESFTNALEKNKLSMGQYFKYAAGTSKTFSRVFSNEFNTIEKVARERVKTLQTQYVKLGRDANGAMKAIAIRPLALDMDNLATKTAIAAQKQAILNQLLRQGSTNLLNFGKNTQWAGRQLMVGFTIPLTLFGAQAARSFMQIEQQAIKFRRVYGDTFTATAETDKMIEQVKELASEFAKYGVQVEKTMEMAADAAAMGKMGADLLAQINESTKLAVLGGVEQEQALQTTIALTNAFGIEADKLASKIDFLNAVENQTVTAIEDLTIAIPKAGPVIQELGGSVEDLAFFLTAMKEGGINASEGANALKSGLARMINPTREATEFLAQFNINVNKIVEGNAGNIKNAVLELATALDTLDPLNKARAIETLFGRFQFARLSTLFDNVIKQGTQAERVLKLSASSAAELRVLTQRELKRVEDSPMFKFQKAVEELQVSLAPLGEAFIKAVTPLIKFGTDLLNNFNKLDDGTKNFIVTLGGLLGVVGPVALMTFGLLANGVANLIKLFVTMGGIFQKSKLGTTDLATSTQYLTQEQLEADAVAASLNSKHIALTNTFTSEASAINQLVIAYNRALTAQGRLVGVTPAKGQVLNPALKLADGIQSVPGRRGAGDVVPAMLSPGEAVIPAKQSKKYAGFIQGILGDNIPGFKFGKLGLAAKFGNRFKGTVVETMFRRLTGQNLDRIRFNQTSFENRLKENAIRRPGKDVAVRMFSDDLVGALGRGEKRYRNIFEVGGKSRGSLDEATGQRAIAEKQLFKLDESARPSLRPAYGYVVKRDLPQIKYGKTSIADRLFGADSTFGGMNPKYLARDNVAQSMSVMNQKTYRYGDIAMILKRRALRGRTTITQGDSINAALGKYATPAKFGTLSRARLKAAKTTGKGQSDFVEAQILGGFSFKDIKRIVSTEPQTIIGLQTALKAAGIRGVRVGMPKLTMMQKIRAALRMGPGSPTKLPRMQSEGPYKDRYFNDPTILSSGRKLWLNKGIVSVPGPRGAGDVVPAMLSPGEAVIPTKFADKYAPLINGMVSGSIPGFMAGRAGEGNSRMWFDPKNTLQASHMREETSLLSQAEARRMLRREVDKAIRMGILSRSDIDTKAISGLTGQNKLYSQQLALMQSGTNQATTTRGGGAVSKSDFGSFVRNNPGMMGAGTAANLEFLKGTAQGGRYSAVTDKTLTKYLKDFDKSITQQLKLLNKKTLTERDQYRIFKKARVDAERQISNISQRSAIKLVNRFGDLRLSPGTPGKLAQGASDQGRTMRPSPVKNYGNAQKRTQGIRSRLATLMGRPDTFLSQANMMLPQAMKAQIQPLLGALPPEARAAAERDLIAAKGDPKKLQAVANKIIKGDYGKLAATSQKQTSGKAAATKPAKPSTKATNKRAPARPKPVSNVLLRENLGNGVTRTVSQSENGRIATTFRHNNRFVSEAKALELSQLKPQKTNGIRKLISGNGNRPSLGTAMGVAGGAGMTAGMMMSFSGEEGMQSLGQNVLMGSLLLSMLPMLKNPAVAVVAGLAAVAGSMWYLNKRLEDAAKSGVDAASAMSMTNKKLEELAQFTGSATASSILDEERATQLAGEPGKKRQFGQEFLGSELGQSMMADVKSQIESGASSLEVGQNIANQLAYAVLQGALTKAEAGSIAAALSTELKDFTITATVNGQLNRLMGPNGENLLTDPLTIALNIQQNSVDQQSQAFENAFSTATENSLDTFRNNVLSVSAASAVAIAGSAITAGLIAGGVTAPLALASAALTAIAATQTQTLVDAGLEGWQREENAKLMGVAVQLGAEQLAQNQGILDATEQRYASQIADLQAQKEAAKTDEERLALEQQIADKQAERDAGLAQIKQKNADIYNSLVQQAEALKDVDPEGFNNAIGLAIDAQYANSSDALKAAAELAKESLSSMEDGEFKVGLQIALAAGELDPVTVTNLVNAAKDNADIEAKYKLLVDSEGTAEANQLLQILAKAGVKTANYSVIIDYIMNNGTEFDNDVEALAQIANMEQEYGLRIDLDASGSQKIIDSVSQFIEDTDEMPEMVTLDVLTNYLAQYPNMDPGTVQTIKGLIDNWDVLSNGNNEVNYQVLVDFAIGKADPAAILGFYLAQNPDKAPKFTGSLDAFERQKSSLLDDAIAWFMGLLGNNPINTDVEEVVTGTGTRSTILDSILNKLKQVKDAAIDATSGLAGLKNLLGDGQDLQGFSGFNQQLVFKGYGSEFIDFLNGLETADREKFLTITEDGLIRVTKAGKALNSAFAEAALGDFQFSLTQGVADMNMTIRAMNTLTAAGLTNAEAYEIATDAALAYAIVTRTNDADLDNLIDSFRRFKKLAAEAENMTPEGFLSNLGTGMGKIDEFFANRKNLVNLDFELGINQSGLNPDSINMSAIQDLINEAEFDIFNWEYEIDDLEYLIDGIAKQEDAINEAYDKRVEALEKVNELNQDAIAGEKAKLTIADALSQGDIAAAAKAAIDERERQAELQFEKQKAALEASRERALSGVTATNGQTRVQIEEKILELRDLIAQKEEDVLEKQEKQLLEAERARDVALEAIGAEGYLGKTEDQWRAIEAATRDAVTQTTAWKDEIIAALKLLGGMFDAEGNFIGFGSLKFPTSGEMLGNDGSGGTTPSPTPTNTGPGPSDPPRNNDDGSSSAPRVLIADTTPAELEKINIPKTKEELNKNIPKGKGIAEATAAEGSEGIPTPTPPAPANNLTPRQRELLNRTGRPILMDGKTYYVPPKGGAFALADGGSISGPGTGTSDSIPAMLSDGEYVVRASSVGKLGVDFLNFINKNGHIPGFAFGGKVMLDKGNSFASKPTSVSSALAADKKRAFSFKSPTKPEPKPGDPSFAAYRPTSPGDAIGKGMQLAMDNIQRLFFGQASLNAKYGISSDTSDTIDSIAAIALNSLPAPALKGITNIRSLAPAIDNMIAKSIIQNTLNKPRVAVGMTPSGVEGAIKDRAFRTISDLEDVGQFVTRPSGYNATRRQVENDLLGIPLNTASSQRPIYGTITSAFGTRLPYSLVQKMGGQTGNALRLFDPRFNKVTNQYMYNLGSNASDFVPLALARTGRGAQGTYTLGDTFRLSPGANIFRLGNKTDSRNATQAILREFKSPSSELRNVSPYSLPYLEAQINNGKNLFNLVKKFEVPIRQNNNEWAGLTQSTARSEAQRLQNFLQQSGVSNVRTGTFRDIAPAWQWQLKQMKTDMLRSPAIRGAKNLQYELSRTGSRIKDQVLQRLMPQRQAPGYNPLRGVDWENTLASGGLVKPKYLSSGGFAIGTDTVPAMLTPGEFVMSRYAVQAHGVDKLKAMNSGANSSESVYNYNLSLNVKSEANPDEIARTVMTQIKRVDSQRLRSNRF